MLKICQNVWYVAFLSCWGHTWSPYMDPFCPLYPPPRLSTWLLRWSTIMSPSVSRAVRRFVSATDDHFISRDRPFVRSLRPVRRRLMRLRPCGLTSERQRIQLLCSAAPAALTGWWPNIIVYSSLEPRCCTYLRGKLESGWCPHQ